VLACTVATATSLLLQVPPVVALESVEPEPTHTCALPVFALTAALAETTAVRTQMLPFE
jgi:hypothetical protein